MSILLPDDNPSKLVFSLGLMSNLYSSCATRARCFRSRGGAQPAKVSCLGTIIPLECRVPRPWWTAKLVSLLERFSSDADHGLVIVHILHTMCEVANASRMDSNATADAAAMATAPLIENIREICGAAIDATSSYVDSAGASLHSEHPQILPKLFSLLECCARVRPDEAALALRWTADGLQSAAFSNILSSALLFSGNLRMTRWYGAQLLEFCASVCEGALQSGRDVLASIMLALVDCLPRVLEGKQGSPQLPAFCDVTVRTFSLCRIDDSVGQQILEITTSLMLPVGKLLPEETMMKCLLDITSEVVRQCPGLAHWLCEDRKFFATFCATLYVRLLHASVRRIVI